VVREEAAYARSLYREAEGLLPEEERSRVVAGEIMAGVYAELLRRVERAGDRVLDRTIRISRCRRAMIALAILLRQRFRSTGR
jgi:phytoene/squalene synthetase